MPDSIPYHCISIAGELETLEQEKSAVQQELSEAAPSLKQFYLRELRKINLEIARKKQALRECRNQNPPPPRPDLVAQTVVLKVDHAAKKLGVAALIKNRGAGNANGPFKIDLAVTQIRAGITTTTVRVFEVPAGITIFGEPVAALPGVFAFPGGATPSREYLTDAMEVPLFYRDDTPSCVYEFEFIVDGEQVVAETSEGNNRFFARWWTTSPLARQKNAPFVIDLPS